MLLIENISLGRTKIEYLSENGIKNYSIKKEKNKFSLMLPNGVSRYYCIKNKNICTIYDMNRNICGIINKTDFDNLDKQPIELKSNSLVDLYHQVYNKNIYKIDTLFGKTTFFHTKNKGFTYIYINQLLMLTHNYDKKEIKILNNFPDIEFALILLFAFGDCEEPKVENNID